MKLLLFIVLGAFLNVVPKPLYADLDGKYIDAAELGDVIFTVDPEVTGAEAYVLTVAPGKVEVRAGTAAGLFYGYQTLKQEMASGRVACGVIRDEPRFAWRGFMLDESRHFFGVEKVKQILDIMASYKLNRFHWHLSDEQGWRVEIKAYPELTRVGAVGNNSDREAPARFYTQEQIRDIVAYAAERHIEIIPEIDMPGHASASNRAYPQYSAGEFTFNPGKEETYEYLGGILREIAGLFPSDYLHIGSDEVFLGNDTWHTDPYILALMDREGLTDVKQVEGYFVNRMSDYVGSLGKVVLGWDDMLECGVSPVNKILMWWRHDKPENVVKALLGGFDLILCPRKPMYFDFIQHESHKTGRIWDGFCPLEAVYAFPEMDNRHILGIQANLWTEMVSTPERLDFMVFPRLIAVAEAGWTAPQNKDFEDFEKRLERVYGEFDAMGINYFDHRDPEHHPEPAGPVFR